MAVRDIDPEFLDHERLFRRFNDEEIRGKQALSAAIMGSGINPSYNREKYCVKPSDVCDAKRSRVGAIRADAVSQELVAHGGDDISLRPIDRPSRNNTAHSEIHAFDSEATVLEDWEPKPRKAKIAFYIAERTVVLSLGDADAPCGAIGSLPPEAAEEV